MNVEQLLKDNLKIPPVEAFSPIIPPCFTWNRIAENPGIMGNGKERETIVQFQVDIWGMKRGCGAYGETGQKVDCRRTVYHSPGNIIWI